MRCALAIAVAASLATRGALAQGGQIVEVQLDRTVEVKVNYARGWMCDDASLVDAAVVTRADVNYWRVTGKKLGRTQCRVGTVGDGGPSYVFDLRVVATKRP